MRFGSIRFGGATRLVVSNEHGIFLAPETATAHAVVADWDVWKPILSALDTEEARLQPDDLEWLPPIIPAKLLCVGTNFTDHVAEMSAVTGTTPRQQPWPYGFLKPAPTTLVGHNATVTLPSFAEKVDWEGELAVIIGDAGKAAGQEPLDAVFGYSVLNDLSVRDFIPPPHGLGLDTVVSKGFDGSAPMGPWIVSADEVRDPQHLPIVLRVNGAIKQDSTTANMIFTVRELVAHFARILTLAPGDVIATGTPAGCGFGKRPQEYLTDGDVIDLEIAGIGHLRTRFLKAPTLELLRPLADA